MVKNKLIIFWESLEKTADSLKVSRSAKSLQRQAEIDVASAADEYEKALAEFEQAKVKAKDDTEKGFKNIYEAYMKLAVKEKRKNDAIAVYVDLFEEQPKLL